MHLLVSEKYIDSIMHGSTIKAVIQEFKNTDPSIYKVSCQWAVSAYVGKK